MASRVHSRREHVILALVIWALIPASCGLQAAETLPHPPPLELQFPAVDLVFPGEGVQGATQALAIRETKTEVSIELPGDVLFDFDRWNIRPDAEPTLRQVAQVIQQYSRANVAIAGHTDAKGEEVYNLRLSEKRVGAVKMWLVQHGSIDGRRITTKGWGEAKPIASNTHPDGSDHVEGRQRNRRVEIIVRK